MRARTDTGDRVSNPLHDRCEDPAIWQAIQLLEDEEERCIAHTQRLHLRALEAEREKESS